MYYASSSWHGVEYTGMAGVVVVVVVVVVGVGVGVGSVGSVVLELEPNKADSATSNETNKRASCS